MYKSKNIILIEMISPYPNPKKFLQKEVEVENPKEKAPSVFYQLIHRKLLSFQEK